MIILYTHTKNKALNMNNLYTCHFNFSQLISVAFLKCSFKNHNSIPLNATRILLSSVRSNSDLKGRSDYFNI